MKRVPHTANRMDNFTGAQGRKTHAQPYCMIIPYQQAAAPSTPCGLYQPMRDGAICPRQVKRLCHGPAKEQLPGSAVGKRLWNWLFKQEDDLEYAIMQGITRKE